MIGIVGSQPLVFGLFVAVASFMVCGAAQEVKVVKAVAPRPAAAVDGKTLFRRYCAVCHGVDGKGEGPASATLKHQPSNLTAISRRNSGKFPEDRMLRILRGDESILSHGTQDMPIWGPLFYGLSTNLSMGQMRIHALVSYLEQIQTR
jgi:mono/diheme cytochrome c family protein